MNFVYQSLRKYGHVDHVEIGAVAQTITPDMGEGLGLAQNWGVVIADVTPRGPAAAAGIKPEDVVLAVDGHPMLSLHGFAAALYQHPLDPILTIDVLRGRQKLSFNVPAFPVRDRMEQFSGIADPIKSHIGPPPFPTKLVILAAGVLRIGRSRFAAGVFAGRLLRYTLMGYLAAVGLAEVLKNVIYEPLVLGGAVKLHPLAMVIGIVGGGILFDVPGVLLAIPTMVVFKVFVSSTARQLKVYGLI